MAPLTTLKNTAIVTGSFLSGAMITLSTITVPVLLETSTHPPQLLHQWVRTYHYGHISLPTISIATAILYFYIAAYQGARKQPWRKAALVGLLTIVMVPFTWIVMSSTNGMLFGLEAGNRDHSQLFEQGANRRGLKGANSSQSHDFGNVSVGIGVEMATLEGVRELLVRWKWMHLVRSLFPLMAAVMGVGICV